MRIQGWVWLLLAFVLGVLLSGTVMAATRRLGKGRNGTNGTNGTTGTSGRSY